MITLVVRKSKNYDVGKRANFYDQHSVGFWSIHKKIELWNNTFSMPYFEVRKKLSQIAFCNIEKIGFDSVFDCVEDFCNSKEKNNSEWIVPIDDDDWLHPQLVQKLKNEKIDDKICHWSTVKFEQDSIFKCKPRFVREKRKKEEVLRSCSYATRPELGLDIILNHGLTKGIKGSFLNGIESFYVRSPASVSILKYHVRNSRDLIKMQHGMTLISNEFVPEEFLEKINKIKDLFRECKPIKMF